MWPARPHSSRCARPMRHSSTASERASHAPKGLKLAAFWRPRLGVVPRRAPQNGGIGVKITTPYSAPALLLAVDSFPQRDFLGSDNSLLRLGSTPREFTTKRFRRSSVNARRQGRSNVLKPRIHPLTGSLAGRGAVIAVIGYWRIPATWQTTSGRGYCQNHPHSKGPVFRPLAQFPGAWSKNDRKRPLAGINGVAAKQVTSECRPPAMWLAHCANWYELSPPRSDFRIAGLRRPQCIRKPWHRAFRRQTPACLTPCRVAFSANRRNGGRSCKKGILPRSKPAS